MQPRCISASPGKRGLGARQFACGVEVIRPLTFCFSSLPTHQLQPLPPPLRLLTDLRGCIGTFVSMFNLMLSALAWSHWKRICTLAAVPACPSGTAPSRLSPCTRSTPSRARSRGRGPEAPDAVTSGGWHPLAPRSQGSAKDHHTPLPTCARCCSSRLPSPGPFRARACRWNTPTLGSGPRPPPTAACHSEFCSLAVWPLTDLSVRPRTLNETCPFQRLHVVDRLHTKPRFHVAPHKELMELGKLHGIQHGIQTPRLVQRHQSLPVCTHRLPSAGERKMEKPQAAHSVLPRPAH